MGDYLSFFPKPLIEDIIKEKCLPIIGSGFSLNADMHDCTMPLWNDLGEKFASYLKGYEYTKTNALDAISAYSHEYTRNSLINKLFDFLNINKVSPGETHKAFAELPFSIICTTNFDFLLENSCQLCRPIVEESQLSLSTDEKTKLILKLHGDLNHPNQLVVTEEDYDLFPERKPLFSTYLSYLLIVKTPLFIGYSIDDPDFRQIFKIVNDRLGQSRRPAYTIQINASDYTIAKYERRGVKVVNIKDNEATDPKLHYPKIFSKIFKELKLYWDEQTIKGITFTQKEPVKQLVGDAEFQKRLCFFSIPYSIMPLYKDLIYPIIDKYGFVPISTDSVVSTSDSLIAKISAVIDKAELFICDITEENNLNVLSELNMAMACRNKKILIIGNKNNSCLNYYKLKDCKYIEKDDGLSFVAGVNDWLKNIYESYRKTFDEEPMRLLKKDEFRSAIISAFTLLEIELNNYYERKNIDYRNDPIPFIKLSKKLNGIVSIDETKILKLREWRHTRNKLVHTNAEIEKKDAESIVNGLMEIIDLIRKSK